MKRRVGRLLLVAIACAMRAGVCADPEGPLAISGLPEGCSGEEVVEFEVANVSDRQLGLTLTGEYRREDGSWSEWPFRIEDNTARKIASVHQLAAAGKVRFAWRISEVVRGFESEAGSSGGTRLTLRVVATVIPARGASAAVVASPSFCWTREPERR